MPIYLSGPNELSLDCGKSSFGRVIDVPVTDALMPREKGPTWHPAIIFLVPSMFTPSMSDLFRELVPVGAAVAQWNTTSMPLQAVLTWRDENDEGGQLMKHP